MGFELNPYDPCVVNYMIDGKQCTIVWYVDDNKISHVSEKVVTNIVEGNEAIEAKFGKMMVVRGKKHIFLGMDIVFNGDGTAMILMKDYLAESIVDSGMDASKTAATPARKNPFNIHEESPLLSSSKSDLFRRAIYSTVS